MGFDNECILNIQSLAGEYFCPVCRTLVYPNEALQTQCTHLYCRPCLTYVASSTQACPYDGYLVTEAGSKPLTETNKALAETIGKVAVHCLYHRSGCTWQGPLSECTTHCTGCAFGNSPVVCNRCGVQIVHRQVQEHAQSCNVNGTNSQPQQGPDTVQPVATSGASVPIDQSKSVTQAGVPTSQPQVSQTATGPSPGQNMNQLTTANPQPQPLTATAAPTPEQLYQQQYQQYYQQYPGYDPYQQAYQQYYPYQQQATPQFQQPPLQVQGQAQSQGQHQPHSLPQPQQQIQAPTHIQPQPHPQAQAQSNPSTQPQGQPQPQTHAQAQPHISSNGQPQHFYPQATVAGPNQNLAQVNPQQQPNPAIHPHVQNQPLNQPIAHGQMPPSYSQVQPHPVQSHAQQHIQMPQYQQPHPQMYHAQPPQVHPHPQSQLQPHPQGQPQFQPHPQPHPQVQHPQPPNPQHAPVQSVAGHHSYLPQPHQQVQQTPPQPHPMQVQPSTGSLPPGQVPAQFAQQPPHMRPIQPPHMQSSQGQAPGIPPAAHPHNYPGQSVHQPPVMHQVQQPMPHQYAQQPQAFAGQVPGSLQTQSVPFGQQHSQARPQGPPQPMQQPPTGYVQPQQGAALAHGMQPHSSQSYGGRPPLLNQGGQSHQFPQSSGVAGSASHARPPQFGSGQPSMIQNNMRITNQQHASSDQQHIQTAPPVGGAVVERKGHQTSERRLEQQDDESHSLKKSESEDNSFGANLNEVKSETGLKDEHKLGNGGGENYRRDESVTKDAVSELQQVQGGSGDPVAAQRMKEEGKDSVLDHSPDGKSVHNKAEDGGNVTVDSLKKGEVNVNVQGSTEGSLAVPPVNSQSPLSGRDRTQHGHHDRNFSQSQSMSHGQISDTSGGFPGKGFEQVSHPASLTDQGRFHHPPMPYGHSGSQQRPAAPSVLPSVPPTGHVPGQPPTHLRPPAHLPHPGQVSNRAEHFQPPGQNHPGPSHPEYPVGVPPGPGPNNFPNSARNFEPQAAGPQGQYPGGIPPSSSAGFSRVSQGEPLGPPLSSAPLPHRPEGQTGSQHPYPMEADMYPNHRPPHFDSRRSDSHVAGNFERGPYGQPFGVESSSTRMNGAPPPGHDSSSAPAFRDEKLTAPTGEHPDTFSMGPRRLDQGEFKETSKQFPRPPHRGNEASPKFGSNSSRPIGGYGMDGPSRYLDKEPLGYSYDAGQRVDPGSGGPPSGFLPPYHSSGSLHPNESGGRPNSASMHDNRGGLDYNRSNSDFLGPMHGFGRNHMDRLPPRSPGNPSRLFGGPHNIDDVDGRERHSFGERFPILPPGHLRRGELDGPGNMRMEEQLRNGDLIGQDIPPGQLHRGQLFGPRNLSGRPHVGEPDFGSFQNYRRSGEPNGPGGFSHQQPFGESFGTKSGHPHLGEPGFRSSYSRQGFPDDSGFFAGGPDSFDKIRKRKTLSMGWCRICKVDCESPEGLDMHGQTREHQRMAMDMVNNIKQRVAKKKKTSNEHSVREEGSKLRNAGFHGHGSKA